MDAKMIAPSAAPGRAQTFNGPLESGLRSLVLLTEAHPRDFDLQSMVVLDYLLLHTAQLSGPDDLHPPVPFRSAEFLVRRGLVERGLLLMMTRGLVERQAGSDGIRYRASEAASPFLEALRQPYFAEIRIRARWISSIFGALDDAGIRAVLRRYVDRWAEEFHAVERGLAAEA